MCHLARIQTLPTFLPTLSMSYNAIKPHICRYPNFYEPAILAIQTVLSFIHSPICGKSKLFSFIHKVQLPRLEGILLKIEMILNSLL